MLTQILNYQATEAKLIKLQRELNNNKAKDSLAKMVATVKQEQANLITLENQAKEIFDGFEKCKAEYAQVEKALEKLIATPIDDKGEKELADLNKKITDMANKLSNLGRSVSKSSMLANQILKDFERVKKNIIISKEKHKQAKEEYDKVLTTLEPQIEDVKKQLASLEKQIDPKIMARYKQSRNDGIFPVFVPLNGKSCGGCSMSLSAAYESKLNANGYVECEQCRRLIYKK